MIVVPVDFSLTSEKAARFALRLARKLNKKVLMVHAIDIPGPPRAIIKTTDILTAMEVAAEENFSELLKRLKEEFSLDENDLSWKIVHGNISEVINDTATRQNASLIVMGTTGASGLKKLFVGSNTVEIIESTNIPVIAVPEKAEENMITHLLYSTDLKNIQKEVEMLAPLVKLFDVPLHILHVKKPKEMESAHPAINRGWLKNAFKDSEIEYHEIEGKDVLEIIDHYISEYKADILAVFPHPKNLFQRIFKGSVTDEIAFHTHIPLLSIKIENF